MTVIVLTVDQRGSRSTPDLVADAVTALADLPLRLPFERTVGDELQGVIDEPAALPRAVERLLRDGAWHIGLGIGEVDEPVPVTARAGRGPAYVHARQAVTAAKNSPWHLRVSSDDDAARDLESVLWLWAAVLDRRTDKGWEVTDLVDQGLSYDEAGKRLGISQSAVSQRAQAAGLVEGRRAREVVTHLAARLLGKDA
jgi:hypothetical protein